MKEGDVNKVAQYWGTESSNEALSFYSFPPIRDYLFTCISGKFGKTDQSWCERWTVETYLKDRIPVEECLSLCCGFGEIERTLADLGTFLHCTGIDLSPGAIQSSKAKAKEMGYNIDYRVADLNIIGLESEKYDLIWVNGGLHHIERLEHVISEIYKSLKPAGIFVCNEYIGPKHQKLPLRQIEIINSVIHLMPPKYRSISKEKLLLAYFRSPIWRRLFFEVFRLLTSQTQNTSVDSLKPKSDSPKYKVWLLSTPIHKFGDVFYVQEFNYCLPIFKKYND